MNKLLIFAALLLASCASKQDIGPHGYSQSYSEGYGDGCHSLKYQKIINDDNRFESEDDYALGWADGFRSCESPQQANARSQRVTALNKGIAADHDEFMAGYNLKSEPASGRPVRSIRVDR